MGHAQGRGPIVPVRDSARLHPTKPLREFMDANAAWPTVAQPPAHAPGLDPTEGVWSLAGRDIGNLAVVGPARRGGGRGSAGPCGDPSRQPLPGRNTRTSTAPGGHAVRRGMDSLRG